MRFTRRLLAALTPLAAGPSSCRARRRAGSQPSGPLIVPFSAGGGVDAIARLLAEKLRDTLKQNIVVENKPGAAACWARNTWPAAPDGCHAAAGLGRRDGDQPLCLRAASYSPEKDLAPVTLVTRVPNVGGGAVPAGVQRGRAGRGARAKPGALTYATSGVGNPQHLNGELLIAGRHHHGPCAEARPASWPTASGNVDTTFVRAPRPSSRADA